MTPGYRRVSVRWLDAEGCNDQENVEDVLRGSIGVEREDMGWLVRDDDAGVILAGSLISDGTIDRRLSIPRAYVLGPVHELAVKRAKRVKVVQP